MVLRRDEPFAQVVVPDHKELDRGTLRAILRGAGVAIEEFIGLLDDISHSVPAVGPGRALWKVALPIKLTLATLVTSSRSLRRTIRLGQIVSRVRGVAQAIEPTQC